jgi:putative sterol carrier protein
MKRALIFCLVATSAFAAANQHTSATPQDVFDSMREVFRADKAAGVHAKFQWDISGPRGGHWWIEVNDRTFKMGRGKIPDPNVTFVVSDNDWVAISNEQLSGTWAYLTGRLRVHGSQMLARKLDEMF